MPNPSVSSRRFKHPSEFESLEGFASDTVAVERDFESALGDYDLDADIRCGIRSCRTWHRFGYVVKLKDGRITNVGNKCGEIFGELFSTARRAIETQREIEAVDATLHSYLARLEEYDIKVRQMSGGPLSPLGLPVTLRWFRDSYPLYQALHERARQNRAVVSTPRRRTEAEIESLRATSTGLSEDALHFEEKVVGTLSGLRALLVDTESEIRSKLIAPLSALRLLAADAPYLARKRLSKQLGEMDTVITLMESVERDAEAFFTPSNFEVLKMMPANEWQSASLRTFRWDFSLHRPIEDRPKARGRQR